MEAPYGRYKFFGVVFFGKTHYLQLYQPAITIVETTVKNNIRDFPSRAPYMGGGGGGGGREGGGGGGRDRAEGTRAQGRSKRE
eukprot:SAG11_NODE_29163_length_314_cov_0.530233_1_plen_82_part_10